MVINRGRKYVYQFNNDIIFFIPVVDTMKTVSITCHEDEDFSFFMFGPEIYKEVEMGIKEVVIDDVGTFSNCIMRVSCPNPGNNIEIKIYELDGSMIFNISDILYHYNEGTDNVINTRTSREDDAFWVTGEMPENWSDEKTYYTVTYVDYPDIFATQLVEENHPVPFLDEDPVKRKHNFIDWYLDDEYDIVFDPYQPITRDITVHSRWERIWYPMCTVMFMIRDNIYDSQEVEQYDWVAMPPTPHRHNMTFAGWYLDAGFSRKFYHNMPIEYDTIIFSKWYDANGNLEPVIPIFTVRFHAFGRVFKEVKVPKNNFVDVLDYPKPREGYIFYGWYTDEDYTNVYNFYYPVIADIDIYSRWIPFEDTDEGEVTTINTLRFKVNPITGATSVEEYDIDGISYETSDITGSTIVTIYKPGEYILNGTGRNVYVNVNDDLGGDVTIHMYNLSIDNSNFELGDRTCQSFIDGGIKNIVRVFIDGVSSIGTKYELDELELIAHEDEESDVIYKKPGIFNMLLYTDSDNYNNTEACKVTFRYDNIIYFVKEVEPGGTLEIPEVPASDGYYFAGWFLDRECKNFYNFWQFVYEDFDLYALWVKRYYEDIEVTTNNTLVFNYEEDTRTTSVHHLELDGISYQENPNTKAIHVVINKNGSYIFKGTGQNIYITVTGELNIVNIHLDDFHTDNTSLIAEGRHTLALIESENTDNTIIHINSYSSIITDIENTERALIHTFNNYSIVNEDYLYYIKMDGYSYIVPPSNSKNSITFSSFLGDISYEAEGLDGMYIEKVDDDTNYRITITKSGTYTISGHTANTFLNVNQNLLNVTIKLVGFYNDMHNLNVLGRNSLSFIENSGNSNVRILLYGENVIKTVLDSENDEPLYSFGTPNIGGTGTIEYIKAEGSGTYIEPISIDLEETDNILVFINYNESTHILEGRSLDGMSYSTDPISGYTRIVINKSGTYILSGDISNFYVDIMNGVENVIIQTLDLNVDNSQLNVVDRTNAMIMANDSRTNLTILGVGENYLYARTGSSNNPIIDDNTSFAYTGTGVFVGEDTSGGITVLIDDPSTINTIEFEYDEEGITKITGTNLTGASYDKDIDGNTRIHITKGGLYTLTGTGENVYIVVDPDITGVLLRLNKFYVDNTQMTISNYFVSVGGTTNAEIDLDSVMVMYSNPLMSFTDRAVLNDPTDTYTLYIPKNN